MQGLDPRRDGLKADFSQTGELDVHDELDDVRVAEVAVEPLHR